MKKTILTSILSSAILMNMSFAGLQTQSFHGNSQIGLTYFETDWDFPHLSKFEVIKHSLESIDLRATLNQVDNGRAIIHLSTEPTRGCAGLSTTLFAEEDGFSGYELYASKADWTSGKSIGRAIKYEHNLELTFSSQQDFIITTVGKDGYNCLWNLGQNFNAQLTSWTLPDKQQETKQVDESAKY